VGFSSGKGGRVRVLDLLGCLACWLVILELRACNVFAQRAQWFPED
jgi:hypothetical protein